MTLDSLGYLPNPKPKVWGDRELEYHYNHIEWAIGLDPNKAIDKESGRSVEMVG